MTPRVSASPPGAAVPRAALDRVWYPSRYADVDTKLAEVTCSGWPTLKNLEDVPFQVFQVSVKY